MFNTSRRDLLKTSFALGAAAGLGGLVAGCQAGGARGPGLSGGQKLVLPQYVPQAKAKPDLPAIDPTGTCGYTKYPAERFSTVEGKVLTSGKRITAILPISSQPPAARGQNKVWSNAETKLGGEIDMILITESDYRQRFNTTIAGGDLPDLVFFQPIAGYNQLLEAAFEDLTPFLSGDAIQEYPNLASIPAAVWEATAKGGRLYGLPVPRNGMSGLGNYHAEMFDEIGGYPKDLDEYLAYLHELTRPSQRRWGMVAHASQGYNLNQFLQLVGAPSQWRQEPDGHLTNVIETDEYAKALEICAKLFSDGVYHPDTGAPNAKIKAIFDNGEAAVNGDTVTGLLGAVREMSAIDKSFRPRAIIPFKGSKGVAWMDFLTKQMTVIKKAEKERVKEILRLCNYLAAPLGSDEDLVLSYGVEGETFDFKNGVPEVRKEFQPHASIPWKSIAAGPMTFFDDRFPATVEPRYQGTKELSQFLVKDPCAGAYSATQAERGATLAQNMQDFSSDVIAGRQKLGGLPDAVKKWRNDGGDKMREEFAEDLGRKG